MFPHPLGRKAEDAIPVVESEHHLKPLSAAETPPVPINSDLCSSLTNAHPASHAKTPLLKHDDQAPNLGPETLRNDPRPTVSEAQDIEIQRLQRTLIEAKTRNSARETQLRVTKEGLKDACEALNGTFTEYTAAREEIKTVKQDLIRDHQAIIYRKDIELFALRKINEQREKQLEEMKRQHGAILEVKEEELRLLKDRRAVLELSTGSQYDNDNADHALEVRLLKVKKGVKSLEVEDDKDTIISQLQEELAIARRSTEAVVNQEAELQRAWEFTKKIQNALKEERDLHTQTRELLQNKRTEASAKSNQENDPAISTRRLPTIEEDEQDRSELEVMFEAAQKNNSELNYKLVVLEKRLRDANSRLFSAAQETEALREQVRFEQRRKHSLENARSSTTHREQLAHVAAELDEARNIIAVKDKEIRRYKKSMSETDRYVGRLRREIDIAVKFHDEDQNEIESLKEIISDVQRNKAQLVPHHEQNASHRTCPPITSADANSAQDSGATLLQEPNLQTRRPLNAPAALSAEPLPQTRRRRPHSQSVPIRPTTLSNLVSNNDDQLHSHQPQTARKTSLGLRDMIRKIVHKDDHDLPNASADHVQESKVKQFDRSRMRDAIASMTPKAMPPPNTAAPTSSVPVAAMKSVSRKPTPASAAIPEDVGPPGYKRTSMRYYTKPALKEDERPQTGVSKDVKTDKHRSWGAEVQTKLKRRSLY